MQFACNQGFRISHLNQWVRVSDNKISKNPTIGKNKIGATNILQAIINFTLKSQNFILRFWILSGVGKELSVSVTMMIFKPQNTG